MMGQHLQQDVHVKFSVTGPAAMAIPGIIGIAWETLGTGQHWLGKHRCPLLYSFMASKQFLAKSFQGSNGLLCVQNNLASMMRLIRPSAARFLLGTGVEGKQCVRACCPDTLHVDANATKDLLASSTFTWHNVFFHACLF